MEHVDAHLAYYEQEIFEDMLNSRSPIPLYHQLAEILIGRIRSGEYPPGTRIPSEHALAGTHGIGRPTVRQAIDLLVRKRMLLKKRGSGTYVRPEEKEVDLFSIAGTTSAFHKKGLSVATTILEKTRLVEISGDRRNPFAGRKAYFFSRLSRVEETPVLIEDLYLDPELFPDIDKVDMTGQSLSRVVEENYYMRPSRGKQNFRIGWVSGEKARALDVSTTDPILAVKRFLHFGQTENGVYSELYCRTDQFVFSQLIGGMQDE